MFVDALWVRLVLVTSPVLMSCAVDTFVRFSSVGRKLGWQTVLCSSKVPIYSPLAAKFALLSCCCSPFFYSLLVVHLECDHLCHTGRLGLLALWMCACLKIVFAKVSVMCACISCWWCTIVRASVYEVPASCFVSRVKTAGFRGQLMC